MFRQAFEIACRYPAQEISYTKLLGQLQDQGNTDLVKHYLAEVDFVYEDHEQLYAIEVKSGRKKSNKGLAAFCQQVPKALRIIITPEHFPQFSRNPSAHLAQLAL